MATLLIKGVANFDAVRTELNTLKNEIANSPLKMSVNTADAEAAVKRLGTSIESAVASAGGSGLTKLTSIFNGDQISEVNKQIRTYSDGIGKATRETWELKEGTDEAGQSYKEYEKTLTEVTEDYGKQQKAAAAAAKEKEKIAAADKKIASAEAEYDIAEQTRKLEEQAKAESEVSEAIAKHNAQIEAQDRAMVDAADGGVDELMASYDGLLEQVGELEQKFPDASFDGVKSSIEEAKTSLEDLQWSFRDSETELIDYSEGVEKAQKGLTGLSKQLKAAAAAAKEQAKESSDLNKSFEDAQKSLPSLEKAYADLDSRVKKLSEDYPQGTFDDISNEIKTARENLANLNQQYSDGTIDQQGYVDGINDAAKGFKNLQKEISQTTADTEKAHKETKLLGDSLGNIVAKIVAWQVINAAVASVIGSFREAIATMKEVDTELTAIQKVTDATDAEIEKIGSRAYEVASSYGVAVNEYLESVGTMAKAGFENSEAMAELATKTQLVGDVTADVADQFLISANAAYKLNGDITALSEVLDAANAIENNFATSIDKIAAGFPKVASVASMANMSIEELVAAQGTITAVTQESGESSATALRALILNIIGDTETELEDGITWTKDEIESLNQVLWTYSEDVMQAAQDTGELVDPMEAIAGLSQAYKEGVLTAADLAKLESELGGKLRTNQLDALIKNYDMYTEMLDTIATSAGSADAEIDTMLSSWESKTQILQNTWTEFIADTVDTDWIKGLVDGVTWLIEGFGNLGNAILIASGYVIAFKTEAVMSGIASSIEKVTKVFTGLATAAETASFALGLIVTAAAVGINVYNHWREKISEQAEASLDAAQKANDQGESILTLVQTVDSAKSGTEEYTEAVEELAKALGEDIPEAAGTASNSLKELSIDMLEETLGEATKAVEATGKNLLTSIEWSVFKEPFVDLTADTIWGKNKEKEAFAELEKYEELADGYKKLQDDIEAYQTYTNLGWDDARADAVLQYYNDLLEIQSEIERAEHENPGITETEFATQVDAAISELEGTVGQYKSAIDGLIESEANLAVMQGIVNDENNLTADNIDEWVASTVEANGWSDAYADVLQEVAEGYFGVGEASEETTEATNTYSDAVSDAADNLLYMKDRMDAVTEAKARYDAAMEGGEKGDEYKDYAELFNKGLELYNNGMYGSTEYQAIIDQFLPKEKLRELGYDYEEAGAELFNAFWTGIFSGNGEDYGANFQNRLYDWITTGIESGDPVAIEMDKIVDFEMDDEGYLTMFVDDWDLLAQELEKSPELLYAVADALGIWGDSALASDEDILKMVEDMGLLETFSDGFKVNLRDFVSALLDAGKSEEEIYKLVEALKSVDGVDIDDPTKDLGELIDELSGVESEANSAQGALDGLDGASAEPTVGLDKSELDAGVEEASGEIEELGEASGEPTVDINTENAEEGAQDVAEELDTIDNTTATPKVELDATNFASGITAVTQALNQVNGKTATIKIYEQTIKQSAGGSDDHPGGPTLVNEEGPEIIQEGNIARIAGGGQPTITDIEPGAIVYTASETKEILQGKSFDGPIYAMRQGSRVKYSSTNYTSTPSSSSTSTAASTTKSSNYSVGNYSSSTATTASSSTSSSSSSTEKDPMLEKLEWEVDLLESELSLLDEQGAGTDELNYKRKQIQEALKAEYTYMEKIGEDQVEINRLVTQWWKYKNEIEEAELDTEEALLEIEEKKTEYLEKQNDLLEAQNERTVRIYNAEKDQWEWVANASNVKNAQEALSDAWTSYLEAGGSEEQLLSASGINGALNYGGTVSNSNTTVYSFGGVTLTEEMAKTTTVYELAQKSRQLLVANAV